MKIFFQRKYKPHAGRCKFDSRLGWISKYFIVLECQCGMIRWIER